MSDTPRERAGSGGPIDLCRVAGLAVLALGGVLRRRWKDWRRDCELGVTTVDRVQAVAMTPRAAPQGPAGRHRDSCAFESTPYELLDRLAEALRPGPDDVLLDLGCGVGRVICLMAHRGAGRCVGIEAAADLLPLARRNAASAARLTGRRVEVHDGDAAALPEDLLDAATIVVLTNPFGLRTLRDMADALGASLRRRPRRLTIAYFAPIHRWYLDDLPWLLERPDAPEQCALWNARPEAA